MASMTNDHGGPRGDKAKQLRVTLSEKEFAPIAEAFPADRPRVRVKRKTRKGLWVEFTNEDAIDTVAIQTKGATGKQFALSHAKHPEFSSGHLAEFSGPADLMWDGDDLFITFTPKPQRASVTRWASSYEKPKRKRRTNGRAKNGVVSIKGMKIDKPLEGNTLIAIDDSWYDVPAHIAGAVRNLIRQYRTE